MSKDWKPRAPELTEIVTPSPALADAPARERGGGVQSLERAFAILEVISSRPQGISLADLSKMVDLHNSTAFHLVRTMVNLRYVRQDPETKRYHLGPMVYSLAATSRGEVELVQVAMPILEDITAQTGEGVYLAIFTGSEVSVLARTTGPGPFQLQIGNGRNRPGHATALGKILLAAQPASVVETYFDVHGMEALTPKTIVDRGVFSGELERVRQAGIAYDDGEFHPEVRCIAVPVHDFSNKVVAAIGVSGPVWRISLQSLTHIAATLQAAASRLNAELGGG